MRQIDTKVAHFSRICDKVQVGSKYANYEEGVVKIFHMFFEENVWFY